MKTKSKWQERLEEVARKHLLNGRFGSSSHSAQPPDTEGTDQPQSRSAQPVNYIDLQWKTLSQETPRPYALIHLFLKGKTPILNHWNRVSDGDNDYYVNSDSNDSTVISPDEVIMWAYAFGESKEKYEPMTADDIKLFTIRDLKELIQKFEDSKQSDPNLDTYRFGLSACIYLTEKLIEDTQT